jgi:hypothetical protein
MLVHDAWSSIGVTLALLTTTVFGRRWRYVGREGSLAGLCARTPRRAPGPKRQPRAAVVRRNVVVKALIRRGCGGPGRIGLRCRRRCPPAR